MKTKRKESKQNSYQNNPVESRLSKQNAVPTKENKDDNKVPQSLYHVRTIVLLNANKINKGLWKTLSINSKK